MFPNPINALLNLNLDSNYKVTILNAMGQVVYSSQFRSGKHQINLEGLAMGMYVVKLNESTKVFKLLKE